jgi:hypothetical protein
MPLLSSGHRPTERYLGCKQKLRNAVNDGIAIIAVPRKSAADPLDRFRTDETLVAYPKG